MTIGEAVQPPVRMHLVDLRTGEDLEVLFNPELLEEQVGPVWERLEIPGLSHQVLQYKNTSNHTFQLELYSMAHSRIFQTGIDDFRKFLLSLCYPPAAANGIATGGPPRVLLVWPNLVSMTCVVAGNIAFKHTRFTLQGLSSRWTAQLPLEEIRDQRLTSEDVRRLGTRRSSAGSDSSSG
jgi:hypothetical protein